MTTSENRVTVADIVRYLQQELNELVALNGLSEEQEHRLNNVGSTVQVLMQIAQNVDDRTLHDILDDFEYGVNETSMGAPAKAAHELAKTEAKIQELERIRRER